jgi:hypothetical protein
LQSETPWFVDLEKTIDVKYMPAVYSRAFKHNQKATRSIYHTIEKKRRQKILRKLKRKIQQIKGIPTVES